MSDKTNAGSAFDSLMSPKITVRASKAKPSQPISLLVPVEIFEAIEKLRVKKIIETGDASFTRTSIIVEALSEYIDNHK